MEGLEKERDFYFAKVCVLLIWNWETGDCENAGFQSRLRGVYCCWLIYCTASESYRELRLHDSGSFGELDLEADVFLSCLSAPASDACPAHVLHWDALQCTPVLGTCDWQLRDIEILAQNQVEVLEAEGKDDNTLREIQKILYSVRVLLLSWLRTSIGAG